MALFNIDTKLCDIIFYDSNVITVINRFGITLGVGDKTIKEICVTYNLDESFFLTIINTFVNDEYFPEKILKSFSIKKIVDYLSITNAYYEQFQLPNIERHFNSLIARSDAENSNLPLLKRFFLEMKQELLQRIEYDRTQWLPELLKLDFPTQDTEEIRLRHNVDQTLHPIEDKLNDLKSFFIVHLKGKYDINLCHAVIAAIITLEKDIKQNNRIRDRILKPLELAFKQI